jgi:hypothetical protein
VLVPFKRPSRALAENNEETLMKLATFVSCVALDLLLVAPSLGAQPHGQGLPKITVDVPFDFMVGHVMFPAGNYTVKPLQNRTFYLQASHGLAAVRIATKPIRAALYPRPARLMFAEENGHYHLRELWMNSAIGVEVPGPGVEQVRAVRESRVEVPASCTTCE